MTLIPPNITKKIPIRKIRMLFYVVPVMLLSFSFPAAGEPVSNPVFDLHDICRIAFDTSEQIKISENDLEIARTDRKRALAINQPSLSLYADHIDYKETGLLFPKTTNYGAKVSYSFSVGLRGLTALKIAGDNIETASHNLSDVKESYIFQVTAAYYDILRAKKALDISKADVDRLEKHKEAVKSRYDIGEVIRTAYLRANAELSGAMSTLIQAENHLTYTKAALKNLILLPEDFDLKEAHLEIPATRNATLPELKEEAYKNRSDLLSANSAIRAAENYVTYYKKAFWPELTLEANFFTTEISMGGELDLYSESTKEDNISFYGQLSFTLYDGGNRMAEITQAKANARTAKLSKEVVVKNIGLEVERAFLDLDTQKNIIRSLKESLTYSRENFEAVTEQFAIGLSDSIDVMDANTLLVKTERELSEAEFQYVIAELNLHRTKGSLIEALGFKKEQISGGKR